MWIMYPARICGEMIMTGKEFAEYGENQLKEIASKIAETIVIRDYVDGNSRDMTRITTKAEKEIVMNIAVGVMEAYRYRKGDLEGILDMAEFTLLGFIGNCNTYDTIYIPLRKVTETW